MPWVVSGMVLLIGLIVTTHLCRTADQDDTKKLLTALEYSADITANNIGGRFNSLQVMMQGVKGFIDGSDEVTDLEFSNYMRTISMASTLGLRGVGLVKLVRDEEKALHIEEIKKQRSNEYKIWPESNHSFYAPITNIEPLDEINAKVIGFDTFTKPQARLAMEHSRDSNELRITSRIKLIQDADKKDVYSFVMYLPIYKKNASLITLKSRRSAIIGWVDVPFRMNDLMSGLSGEIPTDLDVEIYDSVTLSNVSLLYRSNDVSFDESHTKGNLVTHRKLDIGGTQWTLSLSTTPAFESRILSSDKPKLIAELGAALTILLSLLAWFLMREHQRSDVRYQSLFEQTSSGVIVLNKNLFFVDANSAALELLGYERHELLQMHLSDILQKDELSLCQQWVSNLMTILPNLEEWTHTRKDGSNFVAEVSSNKLENGHYFAIIRDLSLRKKAEQRIKRLTHLYQALSEVNQAIVRMQDESELFSLVCRSAVEFGGMKMAWIGQLNEADATILPVASYGNNIGYASKIKLSANAESPEGQGPAGKAIRENRPVIVNDYLDSSITEPWHGLAIEFNWGSAAAFPIQRSGKPFAVLNVYHATTDAFDDETINLFSSMAHDISFAIDNFDREAHRKQLSLDLNFAYSRISHVIAVNPAVIYTLKIHDFDPGGFVVDFIGGNVSALTGYTAESWYSLGFWFSHVHPEDQPAALQAQQHLLDYGSVIHQYRFQHADGSYMWISDQLMLIRDSAGHPVEIVGAILDVTSQKLSEQTLAESESRMSTILENVSACIYLKDINGRYLYVNQQVLDLVGASALEEVIGFDDKKFFDAETAALIQQNDRSVLIAGEEIACEEKVLDANTGKSSTFWSVKLPLRRQDGTIYALCGIATNITERLIAERRTLVNAQVFESSRDGILITDANNKIISINRAFSDISGYSLEDLIGKNPRVLASGEFNRSFYGTMWRQVAETGYWQGEVINVRKNGEIYPEWLSISAVKNPAGLVEHYIGVVSDLSERKIAEERIQFLSNFDALTKLPNLSLLRDRAKLTLASAKRVGQSVALLYLDIDRFKIINESMGLSVGDELLKQLSVRLAENLHPDDTLCRQGGDEFIVLLPNTNAEGAAHVAKKILELICKPFIFDAQRFNLTTSIGIAEFPQDGDNFEHLAQSADAALFRAKEAGRNNFQFFTRQMHEQVSEVLHIENELRHALERNEFVLYYQPQVDANNFKIIGAEALIRWQHPQKGLVPPARFITIAEESGIINEIGHWVLQHAVQQIAAWQAAGLAAVPVAVNLSVVQFRQDTLYESVCQALRTSKLDPAMLELEMTEGIAMENSERTIEVLNQLNALGVKLSIDDFGTGYSSLSYLKRFKIDKLKIDQSFVRDLGRQPEDAAIVTAIIGMAKSLGFKTIAEGVETQDQLDFLIAQRCDEVQGYLFSKPVPAEDFAKMLRDGLPITAQTVKR